MNEFTHKQLGVIRSLASLYFDKTQTYDVSQMPKEMRDKLREDYTQALIDGLTDPTFWGQ